MVIGDLTYRETNFKFLLEDNLLELHPHDEHAVKTPFITSLGNGMFTDKDDIFIEDEYLVGRCSKTNKIIIMVPKRSKIRTYFFSSALQIKIECFFELTENKKISRISFAGRELNYIFNIRQAVENSSWNDNGAAGVTLKPINDTVTAPQNFMVEGRTVECKFSIGRSLSYKIDQPLIQVSASLTFAFDETNDYLFVFKLYKLAKKLIQFLCSRQNIEFSSIIVSCHSKHEGLYSKIGTLVPLEKKLPEEDLKILEGRFIPYNYFTGIEGQLLQDLQDEKIYTRNIPQTYDDGRTITEASFVLTTAAFEWEFKRLYPEGIAHRKTTQQAHNKVYNHIDELIASTTGKVKSIYKNLLLSLKV